MISESLRHLLCHRTRSSRRLCLWWEMLLFGIQKLGQHKRRSGPAHSQVPNLAPDTSLEVRCLFRQTRHSWLSPPSPLVLPVRSGILALGSESMNAQDMTTIYGLS